MAMLSIGRSTKGFPSFAKDEEKDIEQQEDT